MASQPHFAVAQLGARMRYAVPRFLESEGLLGQLYTDIHAHHSLSRRVMQGVPPRLRPAPLRRLMAREVRGVAAQKISSFPSFAYEYVWRQASARTPSQRTQVYLWAGRVFATKVVQAGFGKATSVFTFNSAGLEIQREAKKQGLVAVMEQTIAPYSVEANLLAVERERWPGWEALELDSCASEFAAREAEEWELADHILCGSEFVKQMIAKAGGPVGRCRVIPYGVTLPPPPPPREGKPSRLKVLFVGRVGLRKGVQYLAQVARILEPHRMDFRLVGPVDLQAAGVDQLRKVVDLAGPVPRAELEREYTSADVFVLPSLCEGSATVCYEAMASGLPVITTPNSGSIVRDGVEGFVIQPGDIEGLTGALTELLCSPDLRIEMGRAARKRAETFGAWESYGQRFARAIRAISRAQASAS